MTHRNSLFSYIIRYIIEWEYGITCKNPFKTYAAYFLNCFGKKFMLNSKLIYFSFADDGKNLI